MKIQKLKSSKLFYKKYPFKIECVCPGAHQLTSYSFKHHGEFYFSRKDSPESRKKLKEFAEKAKFLFSMNDIKLRAEGCHFNIFCMSFDQIETIEKELHYWLQGVYGPSSKEELEFLLDNGPKKILCDKLPKHSFKYRIYLKPKFPLEKRKMFSEWVEKNSDKIKLSTTSKRWMTGERGWAQNPFAYVKDDKTLSMVGLQITGYVKTVEEFIERKEALVT